MGIKVGDVILQVDNLDVQTSEQALAKIQKISPGTQLALSVLRNQQVLVLKGVWIEPIKPDQLGSAGYKR